MNDNFYIEKSNIINHKGKKVASINDIKKGYAPVVVHKGERIITNINKLHRLEKKYNVKLY